VTAIWACHANLKQHNRLGLSRKRSHLPTPAVPIAIVHSGHRLHAPLADALGNQHAGSRRLAPPDADPHARWGESREDNGRDEPI